MPVMNTLLDMVERNEQLHRDRAFLRHGDATMSFAAYADGARRLARALHRRGLRPPDRYAVLAMNCTEYMLLHGVAEVSGFVAVPLNFRLAAPELAWLLKDSAPRVLFFESQYRSVVETLRSELPGIEHYVCIGSDVPDWAEPLEALQADGEPAPTLARPRAEDLLCLMYTSGTTGRPKGAMISHRAMLALARAWAPELAADVGDRLLLTMPLFHVGARSQGIAATYRGATLVLHRSFDPLESLRAIASERITQAHFAPTMLQSLLDTPGQQDFDLGSLKTVNYAAAPMPVTLLRRALERFGPILINGYGQTEGAGTVLAKHFHRPDGSERERQRLGSIGQPLPDTRLKIVDDQDNELATGAVGEICLQSDQNMSGYWNNGIASAQTLRGGWLHTGDLGRVDEEGFVYLVDRKKDMIISGGENIYSREVEEALMAHAEVADAAVIGVPDAHWGEAVKAVVVRRAGSSAMPADLIAHCRALIAGYKCPKSVAFVESLPRLPSGKVSKLALRELFR